MTHAGEHDLHLFDEEKGYYIRQVTSEDEPNVWEVCTVVHGTDESEDEVTVLAELDDDEFDQLREDGPNPKGIE